MITLNLGFYTLSPRLLRELASRLQENQEHVPISFFGTRK